MKPVVMRQASVEIGLVIGTMLDAPQLDWLYYLARSAPNGPGVEVGVWKGGSIVCWARARRGRGSVHAVDSWYGDADSKVREKFVRNAGASGLGIDLIDEAGHVAAERFDDGSVAFCFIDACHDDKEDEGIRLDLAAWAPKIMPGGILAMHDYGTWKCPAVQTAVDAWHADACWEKLGQVGSAIAFQRPDQADGDLDLGGGHTLRFFSDGEGNRIGATIEHPFPAALGGRMRGAIFFDLPATHEFEKRDRVHPKWTVVSWEPLTLTPSIRTSAGALGEVHGFIRQGKWVNA